MFSGTLITLGSDTMRIGMTAPVSTYFYQLAADGITERSRSAISGVLTPSSFSSGSHINFRGFFLCGAAGTFALGFASASGGAVTIGQGSFLTVQKIA